MVRSHIGVITNVRPDHLEEMGPTKEDVAYSLCNTVPVKGTLVTAEGQHSEILEEAADNNGTRILFSDEMSVSRQELDSFSYLEHPQNIAVALDVCQQVGIDRETALRGMQNVQPDLGALVVWKLVQDKRTIEFVNGMAANDPVSTLQIWKFVIDRYPAEGGTCIFFNARDDRPVRTRQMLELTFTQIRPDHLIVRGDRVSSTIDRLEHHSPKTQVRTIGLANDLDDVVNAVMGLPHDTMVYAIGNQVGPGQDILHRLAGYRYHG